MADVRYTVDVGVQNACAAVWEAVPCPPFVSVGPVNLRPDIAYQLLINVSLYSRLGRHTHNCPLSKVPSGWLVLVC